MKRAFVALILFASSLSAEVRSREPFKAPGCDPSGADRGFTLSRITYDSDDLTVSAYLYEPSVAPKSPLPVLVFIRGSYLRDKFPEEALPIMRVFGAGGFITIAPMIRQSDGSDGRDEVGGADLNDIMNTLEIIRGLPNADSTKIFMYGHSRGGIMTYLAVRDGYPLRAAAVVGAITNMGDFVAEAPGGLKLANTVWPDFEKNRAAIVQQRSAVMWPEKLNVPLLILQGGNDAGVNPLHAIRLAEGLQKAGKTYELMIRAGGKHTLSEWQVERDQLVLDWFRRHLK